MAKSQKNCTFVKFSRLMNLFHWNGVSGSEGTQSPILKFYLIFYYAAIRSHLGVTSF